MVPMGMAAGVCHLRITDGSVSAEFQAVRLSTLAQNGVGMCRSDSFGSR